jgi:hypothetical protein
MAGHLQGLAAWMQDSLKMLAHDVRSNQPFPGGKSPFLTIQLLLKFGFDHQTPKPVIFGHQTIKTVQI